VTEIVREVLELEIVSGDTTRPRLTRGEAIRAFCFECMGYQYIVKDCTAPACPLFTFRTGREVHSDIPLREPHYRRFQDASMHASEAPGRDGSSSEGRCKGQTVLDVESR
jgi:hypothetical protein